MKYGILIRRMHSRFRPITNVNETRSIFKKKAESYLGKRLAENTSYSPD